MSILEVIGMRKSVMGGAVLAALFTAQIAIAETVPSTPTPLAKVRSSFFSSSQNRSDVAAHIERLFKGLDVNHDGFVSRSEIATLQAQFDERMSKSVPKRVARMFGRLDADHDGRITQAEVTAERAAKRSANGKLSKLASHPSSLFLRADSDKDGAITRAEFDAAVGSGKIKVRHANMRGSSVVRLFDSADGNKDGQLSLEEAEQAALQHFDAGDVNRDGVLTPEERRQAARAGPSKRRAG
jgi:Ca2+-binding EF-hand superfamily protein